MKKENINYFVVGLFTLAGLVMLFFMLFRIAGSQAQLDTYYAEFENVTGVKDGNLVTFSGYAIGTVEGVEPVQREGQVVYRLDLRIRENWIIPSDSVARIVMPAVISDKQIDISQGVSTQSLAPGSTIPSVEAVDVMMLVDSIAQQLNQFIPESTANTEKLLASLNYSADQVSTLLSEKNVAHLNNLFQHADTSAQSLSQLAQSFNRINNQLNEILDRTQLLIDDNSEDLRYTIIEMKKSVDAISGRIESVMYNLETTSQNMNEFSRTLRNNPSALLGSKPPADQQ